MSVFDTKAGTDVAGTGFAAEWAAWHSKHEDRRAAPDGFLAITSINWLTEAPTRFPDAPGEWTANDTGFATCPLPPAGNRLPVAVEAGEQIPAGAKEA
jgi:uncharacterized protein (DUF1684 family)